MKYFVIVVMLMMAVGAKAQDAKVIVIDPQDAKKASSLYAEKLAAEKDWDDFVKRTARKYTAAGKDDSTTIIYTGFKDEYWLAKMGWEYGIIFSSDFKVIIPGNYKPDPCEKKNPYGNFILTGTTGGVCTPTGGVCSVQQ
jgi:hypothetical protein